MQRVIKSFILLLTVISISYRGTCYAESSISTRWKSVDAEESLRAWAASDLGTLHKVSSRERDPGTNSVVQWNGVLLSDLVDHSLSTLAPDKKAQVDLLVFKNSTGQEVHLPRSLVTKYPLIVALKREKKDLDAPELVVPWTSKPKISSEQISLDRFFFSGIRQIEFTTYATKFGSLYLKSRMDPLAVRGEKIFLQNCTSCHAVSGPSAQPTGLTISELSGEARTRTLASSGHPATKGIPSLQERDRRALVTYLTAFRAESHVAASTPVSAHAAASSH